MAKFRVWSRVCTNKANVYRMCILNSKGVNLRAWPLFLATEEGVEGHVGDLADLKSDSGNITNSVTLTSETADQHLIVLLDKVQATVIGDEGGDLLAVLDQLHTNALPDGRVRLLGLNADLLEDNSLGVAGASEGVSLPPCAQVSLLVVLVGPHLVPPVLHVLTRCPNSPM